MPSAAQTACGLWAAGSTSKLVEEEQDTQVLLCKSRRPRGLPRQWTLSNLLQQAAWPCATSTRLAQTSPGMSACWRTLRIAPCLVISLLRSFVQAHLDEILEHLLDLDEIIVNPEV